MIESSSLPRTLPGASGIIVAMFCVLRSLCLSSGVFSVCRGEIGRSEQNAMLVVAMRAPGRRRASAGREREKSSRVFLIGREQRERKKEKSRRRRRTLTKEQRTRRAKKRTRLLVFFHPRFLLPGLVRAAHGIPLILPAQRGEGKAGKE